MSTTINTYSVGLTLDAADYINKSTLAGNETRRLSRAIEEARSPAEKYTLTQTRLDKALEKGAISQGTYNRLLDAAKQKQDAAAKAAERNNVAITKGNGLLGEATGKLKGLAAAYLGVSTISKSIKLAIDAEQAAASFEVLTGSVESTRKLLGDLRAYSDVSPLSTSGVRDAAKTMLAFNIPLEEVMQNVQMLGDISGGNQQRFDSLTLAFSQMSAAGRLMGQDLLQMINTGFNPLQEISKRTGESLAELKKRMEDGAISSQEVRDAFVAATSEGGKFNGMTEKMAETMGGKLAIAMGDLERAGIKLGTALSPIVVMLTDGFSDGNSLIGKAIYLVEKFADGISFIGAVIKDELTYINGMLSGESFDALSKKANSIQKFIDMLDKRERDRAEQALIESQPVSQGGSVPKELSESAKLETAMREAAKLDRDKEKKHLKEVAKWQKESIAFEKEIERATESIRKKKAEAAERERDEYFADLNMALKAAENTFEARRKEQEKIRTDVARGPGAGIESGTEAAAKFMADQVNAAIAAIAMPAMDAPTEDELLTEAKLQYEEMKVQTAKQEESAKTLDKMLTAIKENGFKRIR